MKTILIPTNFSDVARHATDYAIQLLGKDLGRVILLNAFEQPKMGRTLQLSLIDILKRTSEKGLIEDKTRIEEEFPDKILRWILLLREEIYQDVLNTY